MSEYIKLIQTEAVLNICLNRADKKNALDTGMYQAMAEAINSTNHDDSVRVILISAEGDIFCAGNDLKDFVQNPPSDMTSPVFQFMLSLVNAEKPVVAAVNGMAVGIGTTMLLHCDLVIASNTAGFCLPFVNLALCPEAGSSLLLPMLCGFQKASELVLNGEPFSVADAKEMGLVNQITSAQNLMVTAQEQVKKIASKPAKAVLASKRLLKAPMKMQVINAIETEARQFLELLNEAESKAIMQAFLDR